MTLPKTLKAKLVCTKEYTYSIDEIRKSIIEINQRYQEDPVIVPDSEVLNLIWEFAMEDTSRGDGQMIVWYDENGQEFDLHGYEG